MRVLLVGSPLHRTRLRATVGAVMEVAGEFATLAAARASEIDADAIVVAMDDEDGVEASSERSGAGLRGPRPSAGSGRPEHVEGRRPSEPERGEGPARLMEDPLTAREIQVLELLAEGLSNKAIAGRLGISDQTVKFHVSSISGKLGAANRTDAVRRAVRRGLIAL
jgi:DNA-binding CsgD family transcriptional regulator